MENTYSYVIVDDNPFISKMIQKILLEYEWLTFDRSFEYLADAICYLRNCQADILFLDLDLPDMDGLEILNQVQELPYTIVVTGFMDKFSKSICYNINNGIEAFIEKPINPDLLLKIMVDFRKKKSI